MLTDEQKEFFGEALVPIFQELEAYILEDIVRRLQKEKRFTETAELEAEYLRKLGYSPYKIRLEVFRMLKADAEYIEMIERNTREEKAAVQAAIDQAKGELKEFAPELYYAVGNMAFNKDLHVWREAGETLDRGSAVDKYIGAMQRRGTDDLINMTKTLAFRSMAGTVIPARRAFTHAMNRALTQVTSGAVSYNQAIRDAVKELTASGLRHVDYASGRTMQIDAACRNAVLTASGQLAGEIMQQNIEDTGVPMVQVSSHWGARPSHAVWQGQIYTLQQFRDICGYGEPGDPAHIYSYHCRHNHYPFWPGISEPLELEPEPGPFEINGKTYTYYQATQKQRQMERHIRKLKLDSVYAGENNAAQIKLKMAEYKEFSKKTGIRAKLERCQVVGYDKGSPVPGGGKIKQVSGLDIAKALGYNSDNKISRKVTDRMYNIHVNSDDSYGLLDDNLIEKEILSSPIGRETAKYIEERGMTIEVDYSFNQDMSISGSIIGKNIMLNAQAQENEAEAASTIIHEVCHVQYNWMNTQEGEVNCRLMEIMHAKGSVSEKDIKSVVQFVRENYSEYPEGDLYGY